MTQVTVFRNNSGLLTKRAELNAEGELVLSAAAALTKGAFRTVSANTVNELATVVQSLETNEAIAFGVASSGAADGLVVTKNKLEKSGKSLPPGTVARTQEYFRWSDGPGWVMIDIDLKDLPEAIATRVGALTMDRLREILIDVAPALSEVPMLAMPSASAFLYRASDHTCLRGLTGARFYVLAANAKEIPMLGRRLHERLVSGGYGFPFISLSGAVQVRSLSDVSVYGPEHLDFIGGAACGEGIVQERGEPMVWNADSSRRLGLDDIRALTAHETDRLRAIDQEIRLQAAPEAARAREAFVKARLAAGHKPSIIWGENGTIASLDGTHEIQLTDGTWVSVDEIYANPALYHEATCADPLDPASSGQDMRLAKIFTLGQRSGPAIHSFGHGGGVYFLRASADADFDAVDPPVEDGPDRSLPVAADETERIAAIIGHAARAFLIDLPKIENGEIMSRWLAIQEAGTRDDPLKSVFREVVVPAARSLDASDPGQFTVVLEAILSDPRWLRLREADRQLLLRAAFALFARLGKLVEGLSDSPGQPLSIERVERDYLIESLVPAGSLASLVGAPGSGKSFLALELAARIAKTPTAGPEHFGGLQVQHGQVFYFTSEDADGLRNRAANWEAVHGEVRDNLHIFGRVPPLSSLERGIAFFLKALNAVDDSRKGPPLRLIVIDVLRAAIEGEENSSDVMGPAMVAASLLSRMTGATVLLVHHSALSDPERGRGSSAFTGAQDFIGAVSQGDQGISLKVMKNKSGPAGQVLRWYLQDGVLRSGGLAPQSATRPSEAGALAAGFVIREIASSELGITRRVLAAALSEEYPDLFGARVNPKTAETRVSRSLRLAVDRGWIAVRSGNKYVPGPNIPPASAIESAAVPM